MSRLLMVFGAVKNFSQLYYFAAAETLLPDLLLVGIE